MIEKIRRDHIETCVEVIRSSFLTVANELGFTRENAPRFTAFAVTPARLYTQFDEGRPMYAYFDKNQIIGYYSLLLQDKNECELNNLCVLPEHRRKGIGEQLLKHAADTARQRRCRVMNIAIVEENALLRKWYEAHGAKHMETKKFDFFPFTCGYMKLYL